MPDIVVRGRGSGLSMGCPPGVSLARTVRSSMLRYSIRYVVPRRQPRGVPMTTTERLISADDHVDVSHDLVKQHLATKFHDDYDAGLLRFRSSMASTASVAANQQWRTQQGLAPDPNAGMGKNRRHEANGRAGHSDAAARLVDMDDVGVDASVNYCEVSSFRYLYLIEDGWREATRAFNETLGDFAAADPRRLIVSYQIPIHD